MRYSIWTDSGVTARPLLFLAAGRGTLGRVPVTRRGAGGAEKVVVEGEKLMEGTDWNVGERFRICRYQTPDSRL